MSQRKINGQKETLREKLAKAEATADAATRRADRAEHDLKMAHNESARLRDWCRWNQGTQKKLFHTV